MGKAKGDRRERQAREILEDAGWTVETPNYTRYGNTDFYNAFDLIAMHPNEKVKLVQVKSNRAEGVREFQERVQEFVNFKACSVEYWICHDSEGWRVLDILPDNIKGKRTYETILDERDRDCNMGEFITESFTIREG